MICKEHTSGVLRDESLSKVLILESEGTWAWSPELTFKKKNLTKARHCGACNLSTGEAEKEDHRGSLLSQPSTADMIPNQWETDTFSKASKKGCSEGSSVQSTWCSFRGPSHTVQLISQSPASSASGDPVSFLVSTDTCIHVHTDQHTYTHFVKNNI